MSSLTFESLPDEILMIIFQYSGDICSILRSFLGLNYRLNSILLDKRLHLFTDFLFINPRNDYYDSEIFQQVSQQLSVINTTIEEGNLEQILQPLLSFHIRQKYNKYGEEYQSALSKIQFIRQGLKEDELLKIDRELKTQFNTLDHTITIDRINHMISLVSTKGARLVCDDYELGEFNLAKAINQSLLARINDAESQSSPLINRYVQLFKSLITSNISLLRNREYVGNGGSEVKYFLIYSFYYLQYFYGGSPSAPVNMKCYRAIGDLLLFILQCYKQTSDDNNYIQQIMVQMSEFIAEVHNNLYIRTIQLELVKIVIDQYDVKANQLQDDYWKDHFRVIVMCLVKNRRLDILKYICSHCQFREIFNTSIHIRQCLNMMTRSQIQRHFYSMALDNEVLDALFTKKHLLFILLDRKERRLVEKVLKLSPCLIDQLDEDGNDPLLHLCLKVRGCRHRLVEMLIKMKSDLQRRNLQGQNFIETLETQRNQQLRDILIEHEIIKSNM